MSATLAVKRHEVALFRSVSLPDAESIAVVIHHHIGGLEEVSSEDRGIVLIQATARIEQYFPDGIVVLRLATLHYVRRVDHQELVGYTYFESAVELNGQVTVVSVVTSAMDVQQDP